LTHRASLAFCWHFGAFRAQSDTSRSRVCNPLPPLLPYSTTQHPPPALNTHDIARSLPSRYCITCSLRFSLGHDQLFDGLGFFDSIDSSAQKDCGATQARPAVRAVRRAGTSWAHDVGGQTSRETDRSLSRPHSRRIEVRDCSPSTSGKHVTASSGLTTQNFAPAYQRRHNAHARAYRDVDVDMVASNPTATATASDTNANVRSSRNATNPTRNTRVTKATNSVHVDTPMSGVDDSDDVVLVGSSAGAGPSDLEWLDEALAATKCKMVSCYKCMLLDFNGGLVVSASSTSRAE
jgi:hypothetical protein